MVPGQNLVHQGKTQVWNQAGVELPGCHRLPDPRAVVWRGAEELPMHQRRMKVLGTLLGHTEFIKHSWRCVRYLPNHTPLALAALPRFSSVVRCPPHILQILYFLIALPVLRPFFSFCFTTVQHYIFFFFLQDLCSSSPCCKLGDLVQESRASLRTLFVGAND